MEFDGHLLPVSASYALGKHDHRAAAGCDEVQQKYPISSLEQIAVQKLDGNGRWYVMPCDQIAYLFLGSPSTLRFIHSAWRSNVCLQNANVLLRTVKGATMRTDFRRFSDVEARLSKCHFVWLNRALVGNIRRITEVDVRGKDKQIGVTVNNDTEWLSVSRRAFSDLLPRLGFDNR